MITFTKSKFDEIWVTHNPSYPIESFQEELILDSTFYSINIEGKPRGSFAFCEDVFDVAGFTVLTHFALEENPSAPLQSLFEKILTEFDIKSAIVSTRDEFFLSIAMDFHKSITMQAYIFEDSNSPCRSPEFPMSCMIPATADNIPEILRLSNNYFDFLLSSRKVDTHQLYTLSDGDNILGFGLLEAGIINKTTSSLGIYTIEKYRKKGVGRSMMMHLKEICHARGIKPITGCNWYNKKSKATLESAGFFSKTRLLKVEFTDDEKWKSL